MIKSSILAIAALTISLTGYSQVEGGTSTPEKWHITSFGSEIGILRDSYNKMNLESMYDFTANPALLDRNLDGYNETLYRESTGVKIGANVTLTSGTMSGKWSHEVRLGAFYSNREPLVSYNRSFNEEEVYKTIIYCNVVNEIALDGAYILRRKSTRRPWISVYGGLGANLGATFNNQMVIMEQASMIGENGGFENSNEYYDGKESIMARVYIPFGLQISIFNRVLLGMESNLGVGLQSVINGKTYLTRANSGFVLKMGYQL